MAAFDRIASGRTIRERRRLALIIRGLPADETKTVAARALRDFFLALDDDLDKMEAELSRLRLQRRYG